MIRWMLVGALCGLLYNWVTDALTSVCAAIDSEHNYKFSGYKTLAAWVVAGTIVAGLTWWLWYL